MPITSPVDIYETPDSQARQRTRIDGKVVETRVYRVTGYDNARDAEAALIASSELPANLGPEADGTVFRRIAFNTVPVSDTNDIWDITVPYESQVNTERTFAGSTSGGSFNITQGYGVTSYAPSGITAPNFQGAINVNEQGVQGVDVIVPQFEFSLTKTQDNGFVSLSYAATLARMTGKTNNATFETFEPGELLFLGADFSQQSNGSATLTYKFSASPNRTGITIGSITGIAKKGHEYLWVFYRPNLSGNFLVRIPVAVYVHKVYEDGDFSTLGITS
jgi:hypothetical protein